jgi:TPR repeat protein
MDLMLSCRFGLPAVALLVLLSGCTRSDAASPLPDVPSDIKKQLAFACTHEASRIPPRDPEADQLYKHARWLVKANVLKQDPAGYPPMERLLRIATAHGHDRANIELRTMLDKGQAHSADPMNEALDLVQELIKRGIPAGYYDMGWYVKHGYAVDADRELAFKYYRKAADLGNPEGQYLVGDLLNNLAKHGPEIAAIGLAMQRCAADQGHAKAANEYAIDVRQDGNLSEATKYFQLATVAGSAEAALRLSESFGARGTNDPLYKLGQAIDPERQERYKKVWNFLADYSYLNPKVPEIDTIAPLPPAKLPPWNGKFKWLEEQEGNVPPPLPTEERIADMAKAKGLDPKTGRRAGASK